MGIDIKCTSWCRWYGCCRNTGGKYCVGLSLPDEEQTDEMESKIESMMY